jgi:RNA 2',3'-cyclic 3'-phosphodiesterase
METLRTFVAVETAGSVRDAAVKLIDVLREAGADVKWVQRQNLHLTLKFLGDVPQAEIARVCEAVAQAAAEVEPFDLQLHGAGAFPSAHRPRTVWIGAAAGAAEMITLAERIEAALKQLGYAPEGRAFQPHLTIGRVRGGGPTLNELGRRIALHAGGDLGLSPVEEVVVFSSRLGPGGPTYEALSRARLGGK